MFVNPQLIPDATSLDGLKKRADFPGSLRKHFEKSYGLNPDGSESPALKAAIKECVCAWPCFCPCPCLLMI